MSEARTKEITLRIKGAGDPTDAQLAVIRQHTLADMPAEKLYVRTFVIAHNAIDRDNECFGEQILNDFARTLPGKGLHIKHPASWQGDSGPGEGRWFEAQLQRMSIEQARIELREPGLVFPPAATDAVLLLGSAYMVRTADNGPLLDKIDGGIAGDVSVGFSAKSGPERLRDNEGRELNSYCWTGPGEALEASLVWLGAQPGARAVKSASPKDPNMKTVAELEAEVTALKAQVDTATKGNTAFTALKAALGDNAALADDPAGLAEVVVAGKAYKTALVDDIVRDERLLGLCGDTDEAATEAKAQHAALPVTKLTTYAKHLAARVPAGSKLIGGDPNALRTGGDKLPAALDSPAI